MNAFPVTRGKTDGAGRRGQWGGSDFLEKWGLVPIQSFYLLAIGTLDIGASLGFWLRRELPLESRKIPVEFPIKRSVNWPLGDTKKN